jgi:hypothetical protein
MSTQPANLPAPTSDVLTWLGTDLDTFISGLQQRMPDASRASCESIADDLLRIHPLLRLALRFWWETGEIPDLGSFSGYTVNDLVTGAKGTIKFEPSGVFLMLSTLITDPEKAREQLAMPVYGFTPVGDRDAVTPPRTRIMPLRRNATIQ